MSSQLYFRRANIIKAEWIRVSKVTNGATFVCLTFFFMSVVNRASNIKIECRPDHFLVWSEFSSFIFRSSSISKRWSFLVTNLHIEKSFCSILPVFDSNIFELDKYIYLGPSLCRPWRIENTVFLDTRTYYQAPKSSEKYNTHGEAEHTGSCLNLRIQQIRVE